MRAVRPTPRKCSCSRSPCEIWRRSRTARCGRRLARAVGFGMDLSRDELLRYSRHVSLPNVGLDGQRRIKAARVLLVGAGGLGSPAALYLAAAGVGTLGIVDFDVVDVSNLQRQVLHGTSAVGRPKVDSAADSIAAINPDVTVVKHNEPLTSANA